MAQRQIPECVIEGISDDTGSTGGISRILRILQHGKVSPGA
jgi:uncharacterized protein YerC